MAGLVETSIVVLSHDDVAASIVSKRHWACSPKFSEVAGGQVEHLEGQTRCL